MSETPRPSPEPSEAATFTYQKPSEDMSPFIAFHYVIGVGDAPFDANLCALLGQFQVALRGSAAFHLSHGRRVAPRCALIGPTDRAVRMEATPGFVGVGSGLTPTGWSLAPGVSSPSNGLNEVDIPDNPRAGGMDRVEATIAGLESVVRASAATASVDPRIATIDHWVVNAVDEPIDDLAHRLSVSRRTLERLTVATHGATPKRLLGKYRILKIAGEWAVGQIADWRDSPSAREFSDQSHFIREFRRYVGCTPRVFMTEPKCFARRLIEGQWTPGKQMSISIWA